MQQEQNLSQFQLSELEERLEMVAVNQAAYVCCDCLRGSYCTENPQNQ